MFKRRSTGFSGTSVTSPYLESTKLVLQCLQECCATIFPRVLMVKAELFKSTGARAIPHGNRHTCHDDKAKVAVSFLKHSLSNYPSCQSQSVVEMKCNAAQ